MPVQTYTITVDTSQESVRALRSADVYVEAINRALSTRFFRVNNGSGRTLNSDIGSRVSLQWSGQVNKQNGTFNATDVAFITRTVIAQMQSASRANGWDTDRIVSGLPAMGTGTTRPNLLVGEPSIVRRIVRDGEQPTDFSDTPTTIIPRTIASGNGTGQAVPSTLAVIGDRVGGIVSEYKTPVIAVSAAVVVTVIGVAAWKVFR